MLGQLSNFPPYTLLINFGTNQPNMKFDLEPPPPPPLAKEKTFGFPEKLRYEEKGAEFILLCKIWF